MIFRDAKVSKSSTAGSARRASSSVTVSASLPCSITNRHIRANLFHQSALSHLQLWYQQSDKASFNKDNSNDNNEFASVTADSIVSSGLLLISIHLKCRMEFMMSFVIGMFMDVTEQLEKKKSFHLKWHAVRFYTWSLFQDENKLKPKANKIRSNHCYYAIRK